jgi:hypothetical protein
MRRPDVLRDKSGTRQAVCPIVVFTAPGRVYAGALEPGPSPAVRISGETYRPGDSIDGERIVGVSVPDGVGSRRAAAFNAATLRFR